jgi:hypothetical protein
LRLPVIDDSGDNKLVVGRRISFEDERGWYCKDAGVGGKRAISNASFAWASAFFANVSALDFPSLLCCDDSAVIWATLAFNASAP